MDIERKDWSSKRVEVGVASGKIKNRPGREVNGPSANRVCWAKHIKDALVARPEHKRHGREGSRTADFTDVTSKKETLVSDAYLMAIDWKTDCAYRVTWLPRQVHIIDHSPAGGGPRICVGSALAMLQMKISLATIWQHARLEAAPGYGFQPHYAFNTRRKRAYP